MDSFCGNVVPTTSDTISSASRVGIVRSSVVQLRFYFFLLFASFPLLYVDLFPFQPDVSHQKLPQQVLTVPSTHSCSMVLWSMSWAMIQTFV